MAKTATLQGKQATLAGFVTKRWKHNGVVTKPRRKTINKRPSIAIKPSHTIKSAAHRQMYLDYGQADFDQRIMCDKCGMLYCKGLDQDEKQHWSVCGRYDRGVPFNSNGYRDVEKYSDNARIVEIRYDQGPVTSQAVATVHDIVNNELLFATTTISNNNSNTNNQRDYLYVQSNKIVGLLTVEPISKAYKWQSGGCIESNGKSNDAVLGVYKMWASPSHRRQGVVTKLLDTARQSFVYKYVVPVNKVAFSSPTEAGAKFGKKYMGNESLLVYNAIVR